MRLCMMPVNIFVYRLGITDLVNIIKIYTNLISFWFFFNFFWKLFFKSNNVLIEERLWQSKQAWKWLACELLSWQTNQYNKPRKYHYVKNVLIWCQLIEHLLTNRVFWFETFYKSTANEKLFYQVNNPN